MLLWKLNRSIYMEQSGANCWFNSFSMDDEWCVS